MSSSNSFSKNQKGGIILIAVVVILVLGLVIGAYFVFQNIRLFSKPGNSQVIQSSLSAPTGEILQKSPEPSVEVMYQNPFDEQSDYENPFEGNYENPFNNL